MTKAAAATDQKSAEDFLDSLVRLSPTELEMFLESFQHLPEPEQMKMEEAIARTPAGKVDLLLEELDEWEENPQLNGILETFLCICKVDNLDPEMVDNVLFVIRSEYLQFHGLEPTTKESWPSSYAGRLLLDSATVDGAFRLLVEKYIRMLIKVFAGSLG
jgi:hypothetical protein